MKKGKKCLNYLVISLFLLFSMPAHPVEATGGKSTVGITIQQEESVSSSEPQASASKNKTYSYTNEDLPKTGEKIQGQYILLGIGIIGLLCVKRRWFSYDEKQ